jgi:hypothetical protein
LAQEFVVTALHIPDMRGYFAPSCAKILADFTLAFARMQH